MVRAIDIQQSLAKVLDTERVHELAKQQPESAQRQFAKEFKEQAQEKARSVQDTPKPEDAKIRDEDQAKKKQKDDPDREEKGDPEKERKNGKDDLDDDGCGRIVDIKA